MPVDARVLAGAAGAAFALAGAGALAALAAARRPPGEGEAPPEPKPGPVAAAALALRHAGAHHAAGERAKEWEARVKRLAATMPPGSAPGRALAHFLAGRGADEWDAPAGRRWRARRESAAERYARFMDDVTRDLEEALA